MTTNTHTSSSPGLDILDLLFDPHDGILKEEVPSVQTIGFDNINLLQGSLFDDLITEQNKELTTKKNTNYTDHDYVSHRSPAQNSDSGISSISNSGSPRTDSEDLSDLNFLDDFLSTSPDNNNFKYQDNSVMDTSTDEPMLPLENFDLGDLDLETIDAAALADIDSSCAMADTCGNSMENSQISIDFSKYSMPLEMCTDDYKEDMVVTSTQSEKDIQVFTLTSSTSPVLSSSTLPFTIKDVSPKPASSNYPGLLLSDEEKELLRREGMTLPENMPLTKEEERVLKSVRRKIRNKVSAKDSRKRKVEYVDGLEKRVKLCTAENQQLTKKVTHLEKQNLTIMAQLKKLQTLITSTTKPKSSNTTTTCLAVVLLSFAFLVVPSFNPFASNTDLSSSRSLPMPGNSRSLLHKPEVPSLSDEDPYGITEPLPTTWEEKFTRDTPNKQKPESTKTILDNEDKDMDLLLEKPGNKVDIGIQTVDDNIEDTESSHGNQGENSHKPIHPELPDGIKTVKHSQKNSRRQDL